MEFIIFLCDFVSVGPRAWLGALERFVHYGFVHYCYSDLNMVPES
uniref:Uncharacterized protein n=1 Tax=Anguilla anguilla TaxID=7936 RepID=A0A0E9RP83_ANGAN